MIYHRANELMRNFIEQILLFSDVKQFFGLASIVLFELRKIKLSRVEEEVRNLLLQIRTM